MESQLITTVRDSALACHTQAATVLGNHSDSTAEGIHSLRVQTKRLRSFWELLLPLVGKTQVKSATQELRSAAANFGAARDHHVMVTLLSKLARKAKKPKLQSSLVAALKAMVECNAPASNAAENDSLAWGDEVAQVWRRDQLRWESLDVGADAASSGGRCVRKGLQRIFKKARNLHQRAVTEHEIERWHELRKWVKYLSLTIPLFGDDPVTGVAAGEWARLGKSLGKLHDYDELVKRIRQLEPDHIDAEQSARIIHWMTAKRDRICVQCDMHARRLLAQRPSAFAKTLVAD